MWLIDSVKGQKGHLSDAAILLQNRRSFLYSLSLLASQRNNLHLFGAVPPSCCSSLDRRFVHPCCTVCRACRQCFSFDPADSPVSNLFIEGKRGSNIPYGDQFALSSVGQTRCESEVQQRQGGHFGNRCIRLSGMRKQSGKLSGQDGSMVGIQR